MNRLRRTILFFTLAVLTTASLSARPDHLRVRLIAGSEPLGVVNAEGMAPPAAGGGTLRLDTAYGFSPGAELTYILSDRLEAGAGFRWRLDRRVYRSGGSGDEAFGLVPVYALARIRLSEFDAFRVYADLHLGYVFLRATDGFEDIALETRGAALESVGGGLYAAGSAGIGWTVAEQSSWALDLAISAGYAFHGVSGRSSTEDYPIFIHLMNADFGVDWRF